MPPSARERQLARQRAARRAAREAERAARRRRLLTIAGSVLVVLLLVGGIALLVGLTGGDDKPTAAPSAGTSAAAQGGPCEYSTSNPSAGKASRKVSLPPLEPDTTGKYVATLATNRGTVRFDLLTDKAPCAVGSFRSLASAGFYDDTPCHRLVVQSQFGVLQCGDPSGTGSGGPGYTFKDENLQGATYPRGTVAMANAGPNTNGSQFFLVFKDTQLDPNYTPFGRITSGLDVLDKVAAGGIAGSGQDGPPKTSVQLQKVTVAAS